MIQKTIAFGAVCVLLAGCGGGGGSPAHPVDPASLPKTAATEPHFVTGGAPDDVALRCADGLHVYSANGAHASDLETSWDVLARCSTESGALLAVRGPDAPVIVNGERATAIGGWPAGTPVSVAAFSSDARWLAAAPDGPIVSESVVLWRLPDGPATVLRKDKGGAVTLLTWSADGKHLMTADDANRLTIYKVPETRPVYSEAVDDMTEGDIEAIALSPDGSWFIVAANTIRVRAWRLPFMNTQLKAWGRVRAVFFAGGVESAVTIDETDSAINWNINYGKVEAGASRHLGDRIGALGVPVGGERFFAVDSLGDVQSWDARTMEPLAGSPAAGCSGERAGDPPAEKL